MNNILTLENTVGENSPLSHEMLNKILTGTYNQTVKIEELIPLLLQQSDINPFNDPSLKDKQPSTKNPEKEDIGKIAKQLEDLIQQRKCKSQGICEIRNEIYLETLNEMIRHISMDCPERGILLTLIRNEITNSLANYKRLFDSSQGFAVRRELSAENGVEGLLGKKLELERKLAELKNKTILLNCQLENLDANIENVEVKNEAAQKEELEFYKSLNGNVEEFLLLVKSSDPQTVKINFEKNRK